MRIWHSSYSKIISLENIFRAWEEFIKGKRKNADVGMFEWSLEENLFALHESLENQTYRHGNYEEFYVRDPKIRHIHKASVKDRVIHHLVSEVLEDIFDPTFYAHSYSCRRDKGTHKAVEAFRRLARKASQNNTSRLFVLKCDIKKFFASVDHEVLLELLGKKIHDSDFINLLNKIISSFQTEEAPGKGMPIGNLTSQLFANIYMDPLDQYLKHDLKVQYYIRYSDDFVVLSESKEYLEELLGKLGEYLNARLKLSLHPNKISIRDYYLGIDFLGYVIFPKHIMPRTKTRRRIFRNIKKGAKLVREGKSTPDVLNQTLQSYLGYLSHCNAFKLSKDVRNQILFLLTD
jgi:RNA-directed DNA polymerase